MKALKTANLFYMDMNHHWVEGQSYRIRDNGDHILVSSEAGTQKIPKELCDPQLFKEVFGLTI